jgi:hypothetical protein
LHLFYSLSELISLSKQSDSTGGKSLKLIELRFAEIVDVEEFLLPMP